MYLAEEEIKQLKLLVNRPRALEVVSKPIDAHESHHSFSQSASSKNLSEAVPLKQLNNALPIEAKEYPDNLPLEP
jgi:hypothetical protein